MRLLQIHKMFGYIRPMQGELKVRELERFKAVYCGLCHALGKRYGLASRFILNYELVFLAMLLWDDNESIVIKQGRCIASPCIRKRYCSGNKALDISAGYSVLLAWWKIQDSIADESFIKSIPYRIAAAFLSRARKKAMRDYPIFSSAGSVQLSSLSAYEASAPGSVDGAADKFAKILQSAVSDELPEKVSRPMHELLYHLGRWIYIIDACDDYQDDAAADRFNPVAKLYPCDTGISDEGKAALRATLMHSNNFVSSAFELLPENIWSQIVGNMIYLGMPDACERVFEGRWPPGKCKNLKWT